MNFLMRRLAMQSRIVQKMSLFGAGQNAFGECGLGGTGNQWSSNQGNLGTAYLPYLLNPLAPVVDPDNWASFHLAYHHACAIKSDGSLWTVGENMWGQGGQGGTVWTREFTRAGTASNFKKAGVGTEFTAALDTNGKIWCAGRNDISAQCHTGDLVQSITTLYDTSLTPAPFNPAGGMPFFKDMEVGHRFVLAMDNNNDIWSWGNNGSRQIGRASPAAVSNPTMDTYCLKIDPAGPWKSMSAGGYHAGAIHATTGDVWMWGLFGEGQRGPGVASQLPAVVQKDGSGFAWVEINCSDYGTFLRRADGTLWVFGRNTFGQLGIGSTASFMATPTQVPGNWKFVKCALNHTLGIKSDATLWGWGDNAYKKLGNAALTATSYNTPQLIDADTRWVSAYTGDLSSIAQKLI